MKIPSKFVKLAEASFATLALLFFTRPFLFFLSGGGATAASQAEGNPLAQAIWLVIYLITLFLFFARWKQFIYVATRDKFLLLLVGIALISILWSVTPQITLRTIVGLVGSTLFAVYLAARYSLKEQLRLLAWALGIATLLSLVFSLVVPSLGITGVGWRGIYHHKNPLGRVMSLAAVVLLLTALDGRRYRWVMWTGFALSVGLLVLSKSKTALISFLTVLVLLPLYRVLRWHYTLRIPVLIAAILLGGASAMWFFGNVETVFGVIGKDPTLTGRTDLWPVLLEKIWERPWLGYGFNAFWVGNQGESAEVWAKLGWEPAHAHNGLLAMWLDLGLLGVLLFASSLLIACQKALVWVRSNKTAEGLWPLAYLTFVLLANSAEGGIVQQNNPLWVLYVALTLSMRMQLDQVRRTSHISATSSKVIS